MAFDLQPILLGQHLRLDPLSLADFPALYHATSDPLIWEQHPDRERYKPEVFQKYLDSALDSRGAFTVRDATTGEIIGCTRYHQYRPELSQVEIGFTFLVRSRWGGTYNGEMKRLMLRHAFQYVERVVLSAGPENHRSQRAIEKIGGVRTGMAPNAAGQLSVYFEITAARFAALPA